MHTPITVTAATLREIASDGANELSWIKNLPEVGALAKMVDREAELLARIDGLRDQIAAVETVLSDVRREARRQATKGWTSEEIAAAKPLAT